MLAVILTGTFCDPHVRVGEVKRPRDQSGRMVIEVASAGITKMEPHWVTGWQQADGTPQKQPVVLGCEFAGRVRSLGPGVHSFAVGQNVLGMTEPFHKGAMAEFVSARADYTLPMPDRLSFDKASTLPLAGLTAWQALIRHGQLKPGERVLIQGGAGGVGTFAIQIARWIGAHVVVTAAAKDEALCRSLGAGEVIDFKHERFEDRGGNYDLVFDQIGGDVQERSWSVLKRGGRLITIAGEEADAPDQKRASAMGVSARFFIVDRCNDELRQLTQLVVAGIVRPIIGECFRLASGAEAFDDRSGHFAGKAVLVCSEPDWRIEQ